MGLCLHLWHPGLYGIDDNPSNSASSFWFGSGWGSAHQTALCGTPSVSPGCYLPLRTDALWRWRLLNVTFVQCLTILIHLLCVILSALESWRAVLYIHYGGAGHIETTDAISSISDARNNANTTRPCLETCINGLKPCFTCLVQSHHQNSVCIFKSKPEVSMDKRSNKIGS